MQAGWEAVAGHLMNTDLRNRGLRPVSESVWGLNFGQVSIYDSHSCVLSWLFKCSCHFVTLSNRGITINIYIYIKATYIENDAGKPGDDIKQFLILLILKNGAAIHFFHIVFAIASYLIINVISSLLSEMRKNSPHDRIMLQFVRLTHQHQLTSAFCLTRIVLLACDIWGNAWTPTAKFCCQSPIK